VSDPTCTQAVLQALRVELALPESGRPSCASTRSLEYAIDVCQAAVEALRSEEVGVAAAHLEGLARTATDEWELTSDLTVAIVNCAHMLPGRFQS
jgi:hypothetical protein